MTQRRKGLDIAVKMFDLNKWEVITKICLSKEYIFNTPPFPRNKNNSLFQNISEKEIKLNIQIE